MTSWRKGKSGTPKRESLPSKPAKSPPAAAHAPAPATSATGRSWKKTGHHAVVGSSSEQAKWKERTTKPRRSYRGLKLALGTLVLLGLCLAFFITLYRRPIQTPFIVLGAVEYQESFPVTANGGKIRSLYSAVKLPRNLGTAEDLQHLQQAKSGNISVTFIPDRLLSQEQLLNQLKAALRRATPGGPGKNVLMAYLSVHATVNQAGEPCLLTSESDPLNEATWLSFKTFAKGLGEVHPNARKVLFLDCNETGTELALGNTNGDFVEAAKRTLSEEEIRNLWVMFSHSPGERSWRTPDQGTSPFVTAIVHGLRDWNQADSQTTLKELADHVQSVTQEIVQDRLAATQTPLLIPENSTDFSLVYWSKDQTVEQAVAENDSIIKTRLEDLRKLDEQLMNSRGGMNSSAGTFFAPALAEFLSRRRELETWMSAGLLSVPQADWESQVLASQRVLKLLNEEPSSAPSPSVSLAEARKSPNVRGEAVHAVVNFLSAPPATPPDMPPQLPDSSPLERTVAAWDWLVNHAQNQKTLSQPQLKKALDLLPAGDQISPVEIQFARMLLHWGDWNSPDEQLIGRSAALGVVCRDLAERAMTFDDPRCFEPLRLELEAVAKERRHGEDLLFVGSLPSLSQANELFRQASINYQRLIGQQELIQKSLSRRDLLLSWWLSVPATTIASFGPLGNDVDQALHLLDDRLNQVPLRSDWLQEAVTGVDQSWSSLQQEITRRVNLIPRLRSETPPDAPARRAILDLLENPLIEGFDRHNLRVKLARAEQRSQIRLHVGEGFAG
ncbi:MAG TPA: hypothetical protein VNQ76_05520, partial [Planctomicrobium sp.]|nr:hypothetical protein [Planctomicrobium sp.]